MGEQLKIVMQYCKDITSNKIPSGIYTKKAIQRFLSDIKRQKEESFLYEFHPEMAEEVIEFAETLIIPDISREDGSKNLILLPWMVFIYYNIWGWRLKSDTSVRRFRYGYAEVARKNSKTTSILFPFVLYDFLTTDAAQSYFVSGDGAQSDTSFKEIKRIIKADKDLGKIITESVSAVVYNASRIAFFSSDSQSVDSYKPSLTVIDEYHSYSTDKTVTAMRYGGRARKNSLTMIITSAGNDISGACYAEAQRCKKILNGAFTDETYFGIIYSLDDGDDWKDTTKYIKANPSVNQGFLKLATLENDLQDALSLPAHQPDFKAKTCGIWTAAGSGWISLQKWERNKNYIFNEEELLEKDCWAALDLSSVSDFTALTLYFKLADGKYYPKHFFWIPEETVHEKYKKENINILDWIDKGFVTVIEGATINQDVIHEKIIELNSTYQIRELAYDPWNSSSLINKISDDTNILTVEYSQGIKNMSPATKRYETQLLDGNIVDNNPVMLWMMQNVVVKIDANGSYKPLKAYASSADKIDGVITSIMSLDRLLVGDAVPVKEASLEEMLASI